MRVCVIVDAFSAGKLYSARFLAEGVSCIHVLSREKPFGHGETFTPTDFIQAFTHHNDVAATTAQINQFISENNHELVCVIPGSECGVELADALSESLGMQTSNGTALSASRRNKFDMWKKLQENGIKTAKFYKAKNLEEIVAWINENTSYPVVLKALDSAGTNGVFICQTEEMVRQSYPKIIGVENFMGKLNEEALVQEYLHGTEYVVNSVSFGKGKHYLNDLWEYGKQDLNGVKIYDWDKLLSFDHQHAAALVEYVNQVLDAVDISYGPSHAEVILTKDGPHLVEVGERIGGGTNIDVSNECVGYNAVDLSVCCYTNQEKFQQMVSLPRQIKKFAMIVELANKRTGVVDKVTIEEAVKELVSYRDGKCYVMPGKKLTPTIDIFSSLASIQLVHEDENQLRKDYLAIQEMATKNLLLVEEKEFQQLPKISDVTQILFAHTASSTGSGENQRRNSFSFK